MLIWKRAKIGKLSDNEGIAVSVRELHKLLGIKKAFTHWFKDQQERIGLIEGKDFMSFRAQSSGGRPIIDFITSFDNGKSMYHDSLC